MFSCIAVGPIGGQDAVDDTVIYFAIKALKYSSAF